MTTPPTDGPQASPRNGSPDRRQHTNSNGTPQTTTTPHTTRRDSHGWVWALIGALIVIAVVVAGVVIAGRDTPSTHPTTTPSPGVSSSQSTAAMPSTVSTSPAEAVTPVASAPPTVTGPAEVGGWTVEVLEYSPDVNDILTAADHPVVIEGHKWVGVKLRITNNDPDKASPYVDVGRHIVGTSKGTYYEHYVSVGGYHGDEYLVQVIWLEQGETGEGWLYYQVPGDFTPTGMVFKDDRLENSPEVFVLIPTID
ncbi:hypothetical protein [Actinobaculum sp. 313]|uniref:hypothetical protein n=1 Tax=Actinobaculum sp. 313 TaxID=2495645 RepID=UPI000D5264F5|nr:hypothetical protein [Actinobaculum sp. 313]AWE42693.1 hypothetical protein DDD63_07965 [Actinobaculum sp. 313]